MEMKIKISTFKMDKKKVSIGIDIEEINEKDIPELLNMIREEVIQEVRMIPSPVIIENAKV